MAECEESAAALETAGDAAGLAEAWLAIGKLRFFFGDPLMAGQLFERAAAYASQSSNHYVKQDVTGWLVVTYWQLPVPVDVAIERAGQLLEAAQGDLWAETAVLGPLSVLYAYVGRFADARTTVAQARSVLSSPKDMARNAAQAAQIELIAGDPAAAEQALTEGYQALRAMGENGYVCSFAVVLAEALYQQGRFAGAQQLSEEAEAAAPPGDVDAQAGWRAIRAKVLARRGQFTAARQLAGEAVALAAATTYAALRAEMLLASAEVYQLAGEPAEAATSMRQALQIYEDGRAVALADRVRVSLATLTSGSGTESA